MTLIFLSTILGVKIENFLILLSGLSSTCNSIEHNSEELLKFPSVSLILERNSYRISFTTPKTVQG